MVRIASTFWMLVTLGVTLTLVCEYSASCVRSWNRVARHWLLPSASSALSSPVHDFSAFRFGSLLSTVPALIEPWYSSATVGRRTARPTEALKVHSSPGANDSASFGDTCDSPRGANPVVVVASAMLPL